MVPIEQRIFFSRAGGFLIELVRICQKNYRLKNCRLPDFSVTSSYLIHGFMKLPILSTVCKSSTVHIFYQISIYIP